MTDLNQTRESSDAIYAAGFFDGEGCVNITKYKGRNREPGYRLQVILTNTYAPIIDWFQERWGGKIYEASNNRSNLTEYPRDRVAELLDEFDDRLNVQKKHRAGLLARQDELLP